MSQVIVEDTPTTTTAGSSNVPRVGDVSTPQETPEANTEDLTVEDFMSLWLSGRTTVYVKNCSDGRPFLSFLQMKYGDSYRVALFEREWHELVRNKQTILDAMQHVRSADLKYTMLKLNTGRFIIAQLSKDKLGVCFERKRRGQAARVVDIRKMNGLFLFEDEWMMLMEKHASLSTMLASIKVDLRPRYRGESVKRVLTYEDSNDDDNDDDDENGETPVAKKAATGSDRDTYSAYNIDSDCYGCEMGHPSQLQHMGFNGCLADM